MFPAVVDAVNEEISCGAVAPGDKSPVFTLRAEYSCFTSKPDHLSPYLPIWH